MCQPTAETGPAVLFQFQNQWVPQPCRGAGWAFPEALIFICVTKQLPINSVTRLGALPGRLQFKN